MKVAASECSFMRPVNGVRQHTFIDTIRARQINQTGGSFPASEHLIDRIGFRFGLQPLAEVSWNP
jgi:hypothetical protein